MNGTKKPWQSRTLWGAIIMLLAMAMPMFGLGTPTEVEQADTLDRILFLIDEATGLVGFLMTVYGRMNAKQTVSI